MIEYIFSNYKDDLLAMSFAYIGIISIVAMFLPKDNIFKKLFKEFASIFTSLFKK
jgi:hypothetical protein